ncbi:TetR/AcrR family transcriptional regulator [Pseudonocardia sp. CA-107938]|uniref:TetR/AcrR family transcriptional regulator n=1 Tax=Pseudonocardia sp. CA-107938 TaxID=3240021 RepID=UPI003D8A9289
MAVQNSGVLPQSVEIAWGLRDRPTKGPKPGLSVDRIVEAAVRIAAAEGLAAVSMGRVAKELGVGTMSLYRHVGAKDELLVLMMEAAYDAQPPAPVPEEDWRAGLTRWAEQLFEVSTANAWALRMPIAGPPATPNQLAWMEAALAVLAGTGLSPGRQVEVVMLLAGFVRTEATTTSDIAAAQAAAGSSDEEAMAAYGQLMAKLVTPQRFPHVAAVFAAGVAEEEDSPQQRFDFGLTVLLDGIAALISRCPGTS